MNKSFPLLHKFGGAAARSLVLVLFLSFGIVSAKAAENSSATNTGELNETLRRLEDEMMSAFQRGDAEMLQKLIGDEFVLTSATSRGELTNKQQYIEGGLRQVKVEYFRFHDLSVRSFGNVAVVNCRIDWKSRWGNDRWDADFIMTDVWINSNAGWQIVSRHSSYPAQFQPGRQP